MPLRTVRHVSLLLGTTALAACMAGTPTTPQIPGSGGGGGGGGGVGGGGSAFVLPFALGAANGDEAGYATATDASGNVIVVGKFLVPTDFDPSSASQVRTPVGGADAFIAQYNADGTFRAVTVIGGAGDDAARAVTVSPGGLIFAAGAVSASATCNGTAINATNAGGLDAFIARIDASGNCTWVVEAGGTSDDEADGVTTDLAGNVTMTGSFQTQARFDPSGAAPAVTSVGGTDAFLASYTATGTYRWALPIGSTSDDAGRSVTADLNGNIFVLAAVTGAVDADPTSNAATVTGPGARDLFIGRYSASGQYVWANAVGSTSDDIAQGAITLSGSNLVVTSDFAGQTGDFSPGGSTVTLPSAGGSDVAVLRYAQLDGSYVSGYAFGGPGNDLPNALAIGSGGATYVSGRFEATANFDGAGGQKSVTARGSQDGFLVASDATGAAAWVVPLGQTSSAASVLGVATGATGSVWITGFFGGSVDFDPGTNAVTLNATSTRTAFVAQYDNTGAIISR